MSRFNLVFNPEKAFDEFFAREALLAPTVNVEEKEDAFHVTLDVPGFAKQDLKLELKSGELRIAGEKEGRGKFERVLLLPDHVNVDKIEANSTDGVLSVQIPKGEAAKPKLIQVN